MQLPLSFTAYCSLLAAHCSLLTAHCSLLQVRLLLSVTPSGVLCECATALLPPTEEKHVACEGVGQGGSECEGVWSKRRKQVARFSYVEEISLQNMMQRRDGRTLVRFAAPCLALLCPAMPFLSALNS